MNIAIVGCGSIARVHAECVQKLNHHKIVAFTDINEEQAQLFSRLYQGNSYGSYEEMLSKEKIDVIHICTCMMYLVSNTSILSFPFQLCYNQ